MTAVFRTCEHLYVVLASNFVLRISSFMKGTSDVSQFRNSQYYTEYATMETDI